LDKLKTYFNWSTGKDSALALHYLLQDKNYSIEHLLTSVNAHHNRVSMHGLRRELLQQQIKALGIPNSTIELPEQPSMTEYEAVMKKTVMDLQQQGFEYAAFGDIFLEDLKIYREQQLSALNIKAVFPLWKKDTKQLLNEFIQLGFKAILVCTNAALLDESFAGRIIDKDFIKDLPTNVDACGENGEFHTFCFDGPIFKTPIQFTIGEIIYREYKVPENKEDNCFTPTQKTNMGFWFCDLLPIDNNG
jgi:uncharacterized protein (TIGR00290 family)